MTDTVPTATHDEMRRMLLEEIAIRDRVIEALQRYVNVLGDEPTRRDPTNDAWTLEETKRHDREMADAAKLVNDLNALESTYGCSSFTGHTIASAPKALRNGYAICVNADEFPGSIECVLTFTNADAKATP
jgi:hypothetical protein